MFFFLSLESVPGPYCVHEAEVYCATGAAGQVYASGQQADGVEVVGEVYMAGDPAGQIACEDD